jgi:hypothetical protein
MERAEFIATLDETLISSPKESPRPKNALGKFVDHSSLTTNTQ